MGGRLSVDTAKQSETPARAVLRIDRNSVR